MSCFNCYSSRKIDAELVDKILERGHRLRSAMVQSILNSDPFNKDVIFDEEKRSVKLDDLPKETYHKIRRYLQGDVMPREDEILTLETLRGMSATDLCRATDRTYRSEEPCDCSTCVDYNEKDLKCDLRRDDNNEITQKIQERYKSEVGNYLKFVDSVKVSVNSVILNEAGDKKVVDSLIKEKAAGVGQTFFLEYQIPEVLAKNHQKNRAKVDSGLDSGSVVRLCSRRAQSQTINFKQVSIHDVSDLSRVKLDEAVVTFRLSFLNFKQKQPILLGIGKFSFGSFETCKNFTCNKEVTLRLNEKTPIVVGGLKISIQLGCGRLYFGREFLDAVTNNKENSIALGSDDFSSTGSDFVERIFDSCVPLVQKPNLHPRVPILNLDNQKRESSFRKFEFLPRKPELALRKLQSDSRRVDSISRKPEPTSRKVESVSRKPEPSFRKAEIVSRKPDSESQKLELVSCKPVLFGFVYISEAQFSREVMNSYLTCQLFVTEDTCSSKLVLFDSNPIYNFSQQIPIVCEDESLLKLRENFMIVEFFEKDQKDFLIGLTKLPLHQFYLTYRNPIVVKYLSERRLPVIGSDGWETIYNPNDGEAVGQAQFLVALGTKEQIENLEKERGFKKDTVKAKKIKKTTDVGIQSNIMESKEDNVEALLKEVVSQRERPVHVDISTSTVPELRSTSDLLDSLQRALSIDNLKEKDWFKAHVAINSALHLPSRRKCKSKRSKGRNAKHEDILPSTYVTFEDHKGDLKMTPIVPKSTTPDWEFRCDVSLPIEYLTDNQKYLVFKVWRKSTNTTLTPNMQVDHVIGFATVDLTVLVAGLPTVQGWFNINDLSKKCNGQINIHVTPLENVTNYQSDKCCAAPATPPPPEDTLPFEPGELLGRALKRKFTELDEITQRLRLRLSKVTDESETSNDETADEFERDINTLCVEDDFDMVDFEKEAGYFNVNHREVGLLQTDLHLSESKLKIDQLLEKLSLISGGTSSRYVSGCSEGRIDTEAMLNELDCGSRPNLYSSLAFDREMVQKFGVGDEEELSRAEGEGESKSD